MTLIRPDVPRVRFAAPPLALVLAQVQFEPILRISDPSFISQFQDAARVEYPSVGRVGGVELAFGSEGLKAEPTTSGAWSFSSSDGEWQLVLAPEALTLQSQRHESYELLRDRFLAVLRTFVELVEPGARTRLGLRYVNRMAFDDAHSVAKWRELVRPELLGLAGTDELTDDDAIRHAFGQVRFAQAESQMFVRYGFMESGIAHHPHVGISDTPYFLLDLDHFDVRRMPTIEIEQIAAELDAFHDDIHRVFRWAISAEAARRFEVEELRPAEATAEVSR